MENLKTFESFGKSDKLLRLVNANEVVGWCGESLKNPYDGIILETTEHQNVEYNGWVEEFESMAFKNSELKAILNKMKDNIISFWNDGLTDTYPVALCSDCPDCEIKYNGWREDLAQWSI